jgi:hypothetical protein
MSVNESSATALVRFTGLGIICFNSDRHRGEIAAIRDNKHLLTVTVQKPVFQDGAGDDVVAYREIATYEKLPNEDVQIEIKALREPAIKGYEIYQNGEFDRLDSADVNDFRWIVNMDALHGDTALRPTGKRLYPLTKIYIGNGLFYTHKLDTNLFFEKVEKDSSGTAKQREVFGSVAKTVGVKIEGEEVGFTIRIGGREETHTLRRVEGLPFKIEIKNMDYSRDAVYSDMADYYGYLSCPTGNRFELMPLVEDAGGDTARGTGMNQLQFCHPVSSDLPSIDELSEP